MKINSLSPFLLCAMLGLPALRAQEDSPEPADQPATLPAIDDARVTIPYGELKALLDAAGRNAQPPEPRPPVDAFLASADYELAFADGRPHLTARYHVRSLTDGWQLVTLLGGEARLENAGAHEGIVWRDGRYRLLTRGRGEHQFELHFALPDPDHWQKGLRLAPGNATASRLRVSGIPAGQTVRVAGLAPTSREQDSAVYHLPGGEAEIAIALEAAREPETIPPPEPSTWTVQSEVFVRYREGRLHYDCRLHCRADEGSGLAVDLLLPANALDVATEGDDLDLDGTTLGRREDGTRPLEVRFKTRDVLDRVVQLTYAVPQSPLATAWQILPPRVPQDDATESLVAIAAVDGLELAGENVKDSVQSRRLPAWLRGKVGAEDFLTVETADRAELQANWLPRLETAQAMVQLAAYESQLVADGALLVKAAFTLTHRSPLAWRLDLPVMEEILTCEINARTAQPIKRGENTIEFALPAPDDGTSEVVLCYAARLEPLDRVSGRCDLELPRTELFVHDLTWALALPDAYEPTAVEGNVSIDPRPARPAAESPSILHLRRQLLRNAHPAVELYYQRRGLDD